MKSAAEQCCKCAGAGRRRLTPAGAWTGVCARPPWPTPPPGGMPQFPPPPPLPTGPLPAGRPVHRQPPVGNAAVLPPPANGQVPLPYGPVPRPMAKPRRPTTGKRKKRRRRATRKRATKKKRMKRRMSPPSPRISTSTPKLPRWPGRSRFFGPSIPAQTASTASGERQETFCGRLVCRPAALARRRNARGCLDVAGLRPDATRSASRHFPTATPTRRAPTFPTSWSRLVHPSNLRLGRRTGGRKGRPTEPCGQTGHFAADLHRGPVYAHGHVRQQHLCDTTPHTQFLNWAGSAISPGIIRRTASDTPRGFPRNSISQTGPCDMVFSRCPARINGFTADDRVFCWPGAGSGGDLLAILGNDDGT